MLLMMAMVDFVELRPVGREVCSRSCGGFTDVLDRCAITIATSTYTQMHAYSIGKSVVGLSCLNLTVVIAEGLQMRGRKLGSYSVYFSR